MPETRKLPADSTLLPVNNGSLLVSREHATFCFIPNCHTEAVEQWISTGVAPENLKETWSHIRAHGFFDAPRQPAKEARVVQFQLTNGCNLGCSYCCTDSGKARAGELPRNRWFRLVEEVRDTMGIDTKIAIIGGEPLLVPWAIDLAEQIVAEGLDLTVFSNGLLLTDPSLAERVARLILEGAQLRVSLAGASPAACDSVSNARFDQAIKGIQAVASFGAKARVDLMLFPGNAEDTIRNFRNLRKSLPEGTHIDIGVLFSAGRERGENLFERRLDLETALDRLAFESGEVIPAVQKGSLADRREGCTCVLGHHFHVRSDGKLFGCFKMEECVGDLRTEPFEEVFRRTRANMPIASENAVCGPCALNTLCGGGCRSDNLRHTGDANRPICGPWRKRILCELLAEDCVSALEWPAHQLIAEAKARGLETPELSLKPASLREFSKN